MIWTMLEVAGDWAVIGLKALAVATLISILACPLIVTWLKAKAKENARQAALSRSFEWARAHGGNPEYGGGCGQKGAA